MAEFLSGRGLDCGTSYIITSRGYPEGGKIRYTEFRDAFYRIKPATPISKKMVEKGLKGQQYFSETDGSFIIVGNDAIERAVERHDSASRPLVRGVISPKEKQARRILRHIFKEILETPIVEGEKVVYSIPAQPIDVSLEDFDVGFHADALGNDIKDLGFTAVPLHEAEAICYSELENDDYSGFVVDCGAGMVNCCLMSAGQAVLHYSTCRSGDWLDKMSAIASAQPETVVQLEKENTDFILGQETSNNPILSAVSLYYVRLIDYTIQHMIVRLNQATDLPKFTQPIPIIVAGGTSRAKGFVDKFKERLDWFNSPETSPLQYTVPFQVKEVRLANDPLRAVARGLFLASQLT